MGLHYRGRYRELVICFCLHPRSFVLCLSSIPLFPFPRANCRPKNGYPLDSVYTWRGWQCVSWIHTSRSDRRGPRSRGSRRLEFQLWSAGCSSFRPGWPTLPGSRLKSVAESSVENGIPSLCFLPISPACRVSVPGHSLLPLFAPVPRAYRAASMKQRRDFTR